MKEKKKVSLALQGGGSHGAFTWGIIERLLQEDVLDIRGICGTSAGAMNAAVAAHGLQKGGRQGAIDLLETFWKRVADSAKFSPMQPSWLDSALYPGDANFSLGFQMFSFMTQNLSPYQFNPMDVNPLRDIVTDLIDFDELARSDVKVFVCATNVKTCKPKIFKGKEVTADALMASTCLPLLFKAVEINGDFYWDGGYMGNPPIYPLIDHTDSNDILLLKVNPVVVSHVPKTVAEIQDRINDISFNSSLMAEMRMVYFKEKILKLGYDLRGRLRKVYFHGISADQVLDDYSLASKFNASWKFLNTLRERGHQSADKWLHESYGKVGTESSMDIRKVFV